MKKLEKELQEIDHERFNWHYRNLIKIGQTAGELEYEMMDALHFIANCETIIEQIKEAIEKQPNGTQCQHCADKEKMIALQDEQISLLKEEIETNKRVIDAQHKAIFGKENNLKVCEK